MSATSVVDLSGDGGVTREIVKEGDGKGLATGDIAMVRYTGTVVETGQVRVFMSRSLLPAPRPTLCVVGGFPSMCVCFFFSRKLACRLFLSFWEELVVMKGHAVINSRAAIVS